MSPTHVMLSYSVFKFCHRRAEMEAVGLLSAKHSLCRGKASPPLTAGRHLANTYSFPLNKPTVHSPPSCGLRPASCPRVKALAECCDTLVSVTRCIGIESQPHGSCPAYLTASLVPPASCSSAHSGITKWPPARSPPHAGLMAFIGTVSKPREEGVSLVG